MNYRCLCFVVGLTTLLSLAQGQVAPNSAMRKPKPSRKPGHRPGPPTDIRTFRDSGPTTTPRHRAAEGIGGAGIAYR